MFNSLEFLVIEIPRHLAKSSTSYFCEDQHFIRQYLICIAVAPKSAANHSLRTSLCQRHVKKMSSNTAEHNRTHQTRIPHSVFVRLSPSCRGLLKSAQGPNVSLAANVSGLEMAKVKVTTLAESHKLRSSNVTMDISPICR